MLKLVWTGAITVPFHGYAELNLKIMQINRYCEDVLMIMILSIPYSNRLPVEISTTVIDRIMNMITQDKLAQASKAW